jgi:pimeloyl-ACP methyl ester carboxylesterase
MSRISFLDCSFSFQAKGCGKDIIVLPGFWTNSEWMTRYFDLTNHGKVWLLDPPYSNLTTCIHKHSLKNYTDSTIIAMEKLSINKPIIIAESFGCALALEIEKRFQTDKLVLIAPLSFLPTSLFIQAALSMLLPHQFVVNQRAKKMCKRTPEFFNQAVTMMSGFDKRKLWGSVVAMKSFKALSFKPSCPTLIVGGLFDRIANPKKLIEISEAFKAKLVINKKTGHHVTEHVWPECIGIIEDFIRN